MTTVTALVFDVTTLEFLQTTVVPDTALTLQAISGRVVLPKVTGMPDVSAATHYLRIIVPGAAYGLSTYTSPQAAAKAAVPNHPAHWDNTAMAWVDDRTLPLAKTQRLEYLEGARATLAADGTFLWDSDEYAGGVALDPTAAITAEVLGDSTTFTVTKDSGATRTLPATQLLALYKARQAFLTALDAAHATAQAAVTAATTISGVDAINLTITQPYTP